MKTIKSAKSFLFVFQEKMVKAHVTIEPNLFKTNRGTKGIIVYGEYKGIIVHGEYKADQPENKATKQNLKNVFRLLFSNIISTFYQ